MQKKCVPVKDGSFFRKTFPGDAPSFLFQANDGTLLFIQNTTSLIIVQVKGSIRDYWLGAIAKYGLSQIEEIRPETLLTCKDLTLRNFMKKVLKEGVFVFTEDTYD